MSVRSTEQYARVIDAERAVAHLSGLEQQHLARDLVNMITAYGRVEPAIVDPEYFDQLVSRLRAATSSHEAKLIADDCLAVIDQFTDEPEGAGFYAFGALASVYYASCALAAEADGGLNAVKRFLDLLGAADDDGEEGMFADSVRYVLDPSPVLGAALVRRVNEHAASL